MSLLFIIIYASKLTLLTCTYMSISPIPLIHP